MDFGLFSSCSGATACAETKQKWFGSGFSDTHQQMLSFASPNSPCTRNTGYGDLDAVSMHGILGGVKGPFTPSQWMELEHQALIYKYITANAPVPSNLLNPIRKALEAADFSSYSGPHLTHNTFGWGAYNFGFSNMTDPELGRCRRTDGKKWRCSRDAIADHKYCERHVNRKRSRSRKPVEAKTGTTTGTAKSSPVSSSTSVVLASETSNSLGKSHHQLNNLQNDASNASASSHHSRSYINKANIGDKLQESNTNHEPSRSKFECPSGSLLNSYHKTSLLINCTNYGSSGYLSGENKSQHSLLKLMDNRPENQSGPIAMSWRNVAAQPDRTQLSISVLTTALDFMSSTSSPTSEKLAVSSPVRFSRELDSTQMGLGTNAFFNRTTQGEASRIPISWENSVGGPLGEALHTATNAAGECKNTRALSLVTVGWDSITLSAPSPTGVLQKTVFQSLSNSSAGSSPRTENAYLAQI